jgi:hypothetical protein
MKVFGLIMTFLARGEAQRRRARLDGGRDVVGRPDALERRRGRGLGVEIRAAAGHEGRIDHARRHGEHAHLRREHARQRLAHDVHARLRCHVREVAAAAGEGRDGGDVHDEPVAARLEQRRERANGGEDAAPVRLEDGIDELVGERVEVARGHGLGEAGGVDEDVQLAQARAHDFRGARERGAVDDGRLHVEMLAPVEAAQEGGRLVTRLAMQGDDARTEAREAPRRRLSHRAQRARDEHAAAVEALERRKGGGHGIGGVGMRRVPGCITKR